MRVMIKQMLLMETCAKYSAECGIPDSCKIKQGAYLNALRRKIHPTGTLRSQPSMSYIEFSIPSVRTGFFPSLLLFSSSAA